MLQITLDPPRVERLGVTFAWRVEPPTPLYATGDGHHTFSLRLPAAGDARRLPPALWWIVALLCLHSHWTLLRPCRVRLPVRLPPGHREFWLRLLASEVATLEAYRMAGTAPPPVAPGTGPGIEIDDLGPPLAPPAPLAADGSAAAAFSGGKDSLLQAALLMELGLPLTLVTTTSPMPPLADHLTARRRHVLAEIARRRAVELVEVESDLRAAWRNDFPPRVGYPVAVNEITDTFLYTAALLVVAALRGASHLFLASEAEVQENVEIGGQVVQHPHFMYSAATQGALADLLAPFGLRYGSLLTPLYSGQVQQLLWTRYRDLCDLQYSCWRVGTGEATCSRCSQCLRVALAALALGDSPERMGIDLVRLLPAMRDWQPAAPPRLGGAPLPPAGGQAPSTCPLPPAAAGSPPAASAALAARELPAVTVALRLRRQVLRSLAATPTVRVAAALAAGGPGRLLRPAGWWALLAYARLRRRLVLAAPGGAGALLAETQGFRAGFLRQVDGLVRARLGAILAEHFAPEEEAAHAAILARGGALRAWIAAPLAAARGRGHGQGPEAGAAGTALPRATGTPPGAAGIVPAAPEAAA
jgi:hypothetical protein